MKINSRQKGARGEREFAELLRQFGFASAHRGRQYSGSPESPDVICHELEHVHFEVKRAERAQIWKWMEQAVDESSDDQVPVVVWTKNRSPGLAILLTTDLLNLLRETHND